jgi:hypothetical protein
VGEQEGRQKEECRRQKSAGKGRFGSAAGAESYENQMGALSEYYRCRGVWLGWLPRTGQGSLMFALLGFERRALRVPLSV